MSFSTELFLEYKKRPGKSALARLLESQQDAVYSLCRQVLRHPQDAEDACQEVLLEVSRQVDSIEDPERFSGWLYQTAIHTALDLKRKRGRQRVRDAEARPAAGAAVPPDAAEALYEGLAGLDDLSRQLVVEHYFASRPLRELAAERGCSEVAVWKRIQNARERLKKSLGSAVLSALDGIAVVRAPAGLATKVLLRGGLTMASPGGIKLAIAAPVLLLVGMAAILMARRPTAPAIEVPTPLLAAPPRVSSTSPVIPAPVSASSAPRPDAVTMAPRRPSPYLLPPVPPEKAAAARTWAILSSVRVTLEENNKPLSDIIARLARETGLTIVEDPRVGGGPPCATCRQGAQDHGESGSLKVQVVSIKVQDIVLNGCLRLLLSPRGHDFEIQSDGSLRVGKKEDIAGGYEREARTLPEAPRLLEAARGMIENGMERLGPEAPPDRKALGRGRKIAVPQGESCLQDEVRRLWTKERINVQIEHSAILPPGDLLAWSDLMTKPFLQVVEERTPADHVEQLARRSGLVSVALGEDTFKITTEKQAWGIHESDQRQQRLVEENRRTMAKPLQESGPVFVQDLVDAMSRVSGWEVVPSPEAWEFGAPVTLTPGASIHDALDALKAQGFRWGYFFGKLFIIK